MSLRVLMMANVPPDPDRGAAGTEVQTLQALRRLGCDVDALWADDLPVRRIRHGNLHQLAELPRSYARAAVDALKRKAYDVVHVNQPHGYLAAREGRRVSPRTAFIHRSHGFELNVEATLARYRKTFAEDRRSLPRRAASLVLSSLLRRHGRLIAEEADGHIVYCSLDADYMVDRLGLPRERIAVVPAAAPESYLDTAPAPMTAGRARRVLHVSQFAFFKAPMITAGIMNRLAARHPEAEFTWVCDRHHHDAARALLEPLARERVQFLDWCGQEKLRETYDSHGVFLFPSFYEGFGKVFLEAMSRGCCVVASDAGGMHDLIRPGANGFLAEATDVRRLAEAASSLVTNPAGAAEMSAAAVATARQYTWDRAGRRTMDFYQSRLQVIR